MIISSILQMDFGEFFFHALCEERQEEGPGYPYRSLGVHGALGRHRGCFSTAWFVSEIKGRVEGKEGGNHRPGTITRLVGAEYYGRPADPEFRAPLEENGRRSQVVRAEVKRTPER